MWISTASKPASRASRAAWANSSAMRCMSASLIACLRKRPLMMPTLLKPPLADSGRPVDSSSRKVKQPPWVICAEAAPPWRCTASVSTRRWGTASRSRVIWSGKVRPSRLTAQ
ncbi:hypothetical protein D3C81_1445700 [compost metagenome]